MTRKPRQSRAAPKSAPPARKAAKRTAADPLDNMIAAAAQSLDLTIEPAWLPAVRGNLQVILRIGARVTEFALPDDAEPAPVFKA